MMDTSKPRPIGDVRVLNFNGNSPTMNECKQLCKRIATSETLEEIRFTDCLLSEDIAKSIINSIIYSKSIRVADFKGNNIRSSGAEQLCKMMKQTTTLSELYLEWNALGLFDTSMAAIAEGIAGNKTLEILDISNNQICHAGAKILGLALKRNKTLRSLDLRWNNIGVSGGRDILSALQFNKSLLNLQLAGNNIPSDILKAIATAIQRNVDHHSMYQQHVSMMRSLKDELHHIEHEKQLEVSSLASELEKEKELHESFTMSTQCQLEDLKRTLETVSKDNSIYEDKLKESDKTIYHLEDKITSLTSLNTELKESHDTEVKNMVDSMNKERKQWELEKSSNENRIATLQKERENLQGQVDNHMSEIYNLKNAMKTMEDNQLSENQKAQREKDRIKKEYEDHVKSLSDKLARHINEKDQLEEDVSRLKSTIIDNKLKHDEELSAQRARWKEDELFKCKQYEDRINMLVSSKDELQSRVSKLNISENEVQSKLVLQLKDVENYKQLVSQQQEASLQRDSDHRNEINKLHSEIDNEKRESRNLRNKVDDLEKKSIDLQSEIKHLRAAKDGEISSKETEIFTLKELIKSKEDEIRKMHQDELTRSNMLESALQTYILSARQTKHV